MQRLSHLADDDVFRPIVSASSFQAKTKYLPLSESIVRPFPPPVRAELAKQPFPIRYLIEGLIAKGPVQRSDVGRLLELARVFQDKDQEGVERLLADLYLEERIVSLKKTIASECWLLSAVEGVIPHSVLKMQSVLVVPHESYADPITTLASTTIDPFTHSLI